LVACLLGRSSIIIGGGSNQNKKKEISAAKKKRSVFLAKVVRILSISKI
jgi:hypothetical protein